MPEDNRGEYSPTFPPHQMRRRAILFTGRSGHGKTTLIERLIVLARSMNRNVATIKHTHHPGPFTPGRGDSGRFLQAGAKESILASDGVALIESSGRTTPWRDADDLFTRLPADTDLVLVEGFRSWTGIPRIGVHRGPAPEADLPKDCVAIVSDEESVIAGVPHFRFAQLPDLLLFLDTIGRR